MDWIGMDWLSGKRFTVQWSEMTCFRFLKLDWIGFTSGYRVSTALRIVYWPTPFLTRRRCFAVRSVIPANNPPQGYNYRESVIMLFDGKCNPSDPSRGHPTRLLLVLSCKVIDFKPRSGQFKSVWKGEWSFATSCTSQKRSPDGAGLDNWKCQNKYRVTCVQRHLQVGVVFSNTNRPTVGLNTTAHSVTSHLARIVIWRPTPSFTLGRNLTTAHSAISHSV